MMNLLLSVSFSITFSALCLFFIWQVIKSKIASGDLLIRSICWILGRQGIWGKIKGCNELIEAEEVIYILVLRGGWREREWGCWARWGKTTSFQWLFTSYCRSSLKQNSLFVYVRKRSFVFTSPHNHHPLSTVNHHSNRWSTRSLFYCSSQQLSCFFFDFVIRVLPDINKIQTYHHIPRQTVWSC